MYRLVTTRHFDDDLRRLDKQMARRLFERLQRLAEHPVEARRLRHLPPELQGLNKIRVGDHRVLFWIDRREEVITLYGVAHRRDVYKRLR